MNKARAAIVAITLAAGLAATTSQATAGRPAPARSHAGAQCALPHFGPGANYRPLIVASQFSAGIDNGWFPLRPGTTFVYVGVKDGQKAIDVFAPSRHTRVIDGVRTRVVNDRLYLDGVLTERTSDYYAQDRCGNVWYFGEDTAELDGRGRVISRAGSFHAGVRGAQPGVFMQAHPQLGRRFRQEWSAGNAEDQYSAIARQVHATVPYGTFRHALRTEETTALEAGVVDNKLYAYGIGELQERAVQGPVETLSLVDVLR